MKTNQQPIYQGVTITLYKLTLLSWVLNEKEAKESQERAKHPPIIGGDGKVYQ